MAQNKKKVLFATTNSAKVQRLKNFIKDIDVDILSFKDLDYTIVEPSEDAENGVEIAKLKAKHYFDHLKEKVPVITQDDTFFLEGVSEEDNPGIDTKSPVIKKFGVFNDENSVRYYSELAAKYGGEIPFQFRYGHALCDGTHLEGKSSTLSGVLVADHKKTWTPNYPLNAVMRVLVHGEWKYYEDLTPEEQAEADHELGASVSYLLKKYIISSN